MSIALYRDAALTTKFSSGLITTNPSYEGLFDDTTDFDASDGVEVISVAYIADDIEQAKHHTLCRAQMQLLFEQSSDLNGDLLPDFSGFASAPTETLVVSETFNGDSIVTSFQISKKWIKPNSYTVEVDSAEKSYGVDYELDHSSGKIIFSSAPATGTNNVEIKNFIHADDGAGNINIPTNTSITSQTPWNNAILWDVPTLSGGIKGSVKDCIPVVFLAKVNQNALSVGQTFDLSGLRAYIRGLPVDGRL